MNNYSAERNSTQIFKYTRAHLIKTINYLNSSSLLNFDSYCLSPIYYEFTGRKGLWATYSNEAMLIWCNHPNDNETLLIFPEISSDTSLELTSHILPHLISTGFNLRFSRFTDFQKVNLIDVFWKKTRMNMNIKFREVIEEKLDWKYPSHILDTTMVATHQGSNFGRLRQRLRKLDRSLIKVKPLDPKNQRNEIIKLVSNWAEIGNFTGTQTEDLIAPADKILTILIDDKSFCNGQILLIENKIVSYCVWEMPLNDVLPANQLVVSSSHSIPGIAEWQMVLMCEQLMLLGVKKVNLGGSETHGLDRFKRKFSPIESNKLSSLVSVFN